MEWLAVIGFIVLGLTLILAEVIFIPGTTVVGLLGVGIAGYGVYLSFNSFGSSTGWIVVAVTLLITAFMAYYAFKKESWSRFALKSTHTSKVNEDRGQGLKVGDVGMSISAIKPIGKAEFGDREFEVRSLGNYIVEKQDIRIIKIENTKIFVEPIKQT